jgi:glycosyltransferase involved in cell wall biosynthesis
MKLIIQIPCFNEEGQLALTLGHLPREVPGFETVEWLIIDDGSTDRTVEMAREHGVDHVVRLTNHKGLAAAFQAGIDAGLKLGADVIVNTDGDNQYAGEDIPILLEPIVRGAADMVVGEEAGRQARPLLKVGEQFPDHLDTVKEAPAEQLERRAPC